MSFSKSQLGKEGENLAVEFLKNHGYTILQRNYRSRLGELDVIAQEGEVICFVEVKTRSTPYQGAPLESISRHKQRKIGQMALAYLKEHDQMESQARFDVVAVSKNSAGDEAVEVVKNAFDLLN